jgi:organic radical activating enzyme
MSTLSLMEHFYTIQGEGNFSGSAAYFIRLGGCDVGCTWCDVKESWDKNAHPQIEITAIVDHVKNAKAKLAVITGGEPCMHDLNELTKQLHEAGIQTNIETSGTHPLSGAFDWICFSPKRFKKPLEAFYEKADELKVVIFHENDFRWAESHASKMKNANCKLLLQPEWDQQATVLPQIIDYVKAHPQWSISLQTHKYMNIP